MGGGDRWNLSTACRESVVSLGGFLGGAEGDLSAGAGGGAGEGICRRLGSATLSG